MGLSGKAQALDLLDLVGSRVESPFALAEEAIRVSFDFRNPVADLIDEELFRFDLGHLDIAMFIPVENQHLFDFLGKGRHELSRLR